MSVFPSWDFWEHITCIVLCLTIVPLWQTDSWPPALHSVAPREQPSSSAGRSGPPAHKQRETHSKCATESKVQCDRYNFSPKVVHIMVDLHLPNSCMSGVKWPTFWQQNARNTNFTEVKTDASQTKKRFLSELGPQKTTPHKIALYTYTWVTFRWKVIFGSLLPAVPCGFMV